MVVGDNQVESERPCGLCFTNSSDAAVNGDDEADAGFPDSLQGRGIQSIAFGHAVREVSVHLSAQARKRKVQKRGAAHAIDIVIPIDDDLFAGLNCRPDTTDGMVHLAEDSGVGQLREPAGKKGPCILPFDDPAIDQKPRDERGKSGLVRKRGRNARVGLRKDPFHTHDLSY